MEAAREGMSDYQKMRKDENFQEFNRLLIETESFSMNVLRSQFESALDAQDKMSLMQRAGLNLDRLRGGEQASALDEIKEGLRTSLRLIGAMSAPERRNPLLLGPTARRRLCAELQLADETKIDELLHQYQWVKVQWDFLRREKARGLPLPLNGDELQWMMRNQPTRLSWAAMKKEAVARGQLPRSGVEIKRERRRRKRGDVNIPLRKFG